MSSRVISLERLLFSLLITLGIVILLLTQISLKDLFVLLKSIDPFYAALGIAGYLLAVFLRAVRFQQLLHSRQVALAELFRISAFYHLSLMVLPSKLGEFTYPYLLNKAGHTSLTEGMASLIASRVYDFFIILLIFSFAAIGFRGFFDVGLPVVLTLSFILIGIIIFGFLYISPLLRRFSDLLGKFPGRTGTKRGRSFRWLQNRGYELAEDFAAIKTRSNYLPLLLTSLCSWLSIFFMFFVFLKGVGVRLSFLKVISGSTISVIANALPISGIGNWGTMEAGWSLGFLMAGLSKEKAIATGFGVHIAIFAVAAITGLACWIAPNLLGMARERRQKRPGPPPG